MRMIIEEISFYIRRLAKIPSSVYSFLRWDLPRIIGNLWKFRKVIMEFRGWDYQYTLDVFQVCLQEMRKKQEEYEFTGRAAPKIQRCMDIIDQLRDGDFINEAERRLGISHTMRKMEFEKSDLGFKMIDNLSEEERSNNMKIYLEESKIEVERANELFEILKGNYSKYAHMSDPQLKDRAHEDIYDGTGILNWWV